MTGAIPRALLSAVCILVGMQTVRAVPERPEPRIARSSEGLSSDDLLVYTLDATEFGADRHGKADATAAVQAALDMCDAAGGGTVFLPAGRYRFLGGLAVKSGCTLRGEWVNPDRGGLGKGTILMVYGNRGESDCNRNPFIRLSGGACVRDLSFWYPEQTWSAPVPYPPTIRGNGHTCVINVTLYNSWCGFWNNGCSSMLVRRFYGTPLHLGLHGAYAYDVPRIEHVHLDPKYWAQSGLPGAPTARNLPRLNAYLEKHLVGVQAAEQDWGYWWDISVNHCQKGLFLTAIPSDDGKKMVPGNICAGKVNIHHSKVGIYLENAGYPGFMLTYGEIESSVCPLYFAPKPKHYDEAKANGVYVSYQNNSSLLVSGVKFIGGKYSVASAKDGRLGVNLSDCVFSGYSRAAVKSATGSVTVTRCRFLSGKAESFEFGDAVDQVVLLANKFAGKSAIPGFPEDDERVRRGEGELPLPPALTYDFDHDFQRRPASTRIWNVAVCGAVAGTMEAPPETDSTPAFRKALEQAKGKGGTVYVPAGVYRLDGTLVVPPGVELRGSFEYPHFGNGCATGTQLWVTGGKDKPDGEPFITLREGSGVRGLSIFYPEQGWTDYEEAPDETKVHAYPPTIRTASDCWVKDCTINCCWTAIDALTVRSDNLEIADVTGAALDTTLAYGHGATGGIVRNLHFNFSSWTHQSKFPNRPRQEIKGHGLGDFASRQVKGLVLGDLSRTDFFSCFNITVAEQIVLEKDRYTGGSFKGKLWGVAFDAAHNGVVGRAGSNAVIALIASMGVFFQQQGGYYAKTDQDFKGRIYFYNADMWSPASRVADVSGGTVIFHQLLSWCCFNGLCKAKGDLRVTASTFASDHMPWNVDKDTLHFDAGTKGVALGILDCQKLLKIVVEDGAKVQVALNGFLRKEKN